MQGSQRCRETKTEYIESIVRSQKGQPFMGHRLDVWVLGGRFWVQIGRVFLARDMLSHSYDHGLILKMMCPYNTLPIEVDIPVDHVVML